MQHATLYRWPSAICLSAPLGSGFTDQGKLDHGAAPASGIYDFRFALYDAATRGAQVGTALTNAAPVVSNGRFTVTLDFGKAFDGEARWLEIGVRTNGTEIRNKSESRNPKGQPCVPTQHPSSGIQYPVSGIGSSAFYLSPSASASRPNSPSLGGRLTAAAAPAPAAFTRSAAPSANRTPGPR